MGYLYDLDYAMKHKKRCIVCGCLMDLDHVKDICECCEDNRDEPEGGTYKRIRDE